MVTLQEARQEVNRAKEQLEIQRSLIKAKELEIQSTQLPSVPQRQLQTRGIMGLIKRKLQQQQLTGQKAQAIGSLEPYRQEVGEREKTISSYESALSSKEAEAAKIANKIREYEYGQKLGAKNSNVFLGNLSPIARAGYQQAKAVYDYYKGRADSLAKAGLTPGQFDKLTNEQLNALPKTTLTILEDEGLARLPETTTITEVGPKYRQAPYDYRETGYYIPEEPKAPSYAPQFGTIIDYNIPTPPKFTDIPEIKPKGFLQKAADVLFDKIPDKFAGLPTQELPLYDASTKFAAGDLAGGLKSSVSSSFDWFNPLTRPKSTVGEEAKKVIGGLAYSGKLSQEGWEDILQRTLPGEQTFSKVLPERKVPIYLSETGIYNPETKQYDAPTTFTLPSKEVRTNLGVVTSAIGLIPTVASYVAAPEAFLIGDVAVAGQGIRDVEKEVDKQIREEFMKQWKPAPVGFRNPTFEEFNNDENRKIIRDALVKKYRTQAAVAEAFLVGDIAFKAYRKATEPIVKIKKYNPYNIKREAVFLGKDTKGTYKVLTVQRLPEYQVTNRFREFFGMNPKVDWTPFGRATPTSSIPGWANARYPSRVYETTPLLKAPVKANKPYLAQTAFLGKGPTKPSLFIVIPEGSKKATLSTILKELPAAEKRAALKALKEGSLFGYQGAPSEIALSNLRTIKWVSAPGKSTSSFFVTSRASPYLKTDKMVAYQTWETFKDTSKPFYRASGRIPMIRGETFVFGNVKSAPIVPDFTVKISKDIFNIGKTSSGKGAVALVEPGTFTATSVNAITKAPPFIPKPVATSVIEKSVTSAAKATSKVLGVTARTATATYPLIKVNQGTNTLDRALTKVITKTGTDVIQIPKVEEIPKETPLAIPKAVTRSSPLTIPKIATDTLTIPKVTPITIPKEVPIVNVSPTPRPRPLPTPYPRPPGLPKPIPPPKITEEPIPTKIQRGRRPSQLFIPEVRRRGKFYEVGRPTAFFKALSTGSKKVKETLGASLRIKKAKTGEVVPLTPFGVFRKSKSEFGVLVQRRGTRLSSRKERKEIQKARRFATWWK